MNNKYTMSGLSGWLRAGKVDSIMNPSVQKIDVNSSVKEAIRVLVTHHVKKVLVTENDKPKSLLEISNITPEDIKNNRKIAELKLSPLATVSSGASLSETFTLLKAYPALVVVQKDSHISGIVTMTDYARSELRT
jgi:CBS domain-containing protein